MHQHELLEGLSLGLLFCNGFLHEKSGVRQLSSTLHFSTLSWATILFRPFQWLLSGIPDWTLWKHLWHLNLTEIGNQEVGGYGHCAGSTPSWHCADGSCSSATNRRSNAGCNTRFILGQQKRHWWEFTSRCLRNHPWRLVDGHLGWLRLNMGIDKTRKKLSSFA